MPRTVVLLLSLSLSVGAFAQDRSYGRSMAVTSGGIAATSQYLASQAGADVLRRGGSAIDAAIAANAVPGVVDGWSKAHQRFGRLPWKDLFTSAIFYAEHGYAVPELVHGYWEGSQGRLKETPEAA